MSKTVMNGPLLTPPRIDQCYSRKSISPPELQSAISQLFRPFLELLLKDGLALSDQLHPLHLMTVKCSNISVSF